MSRASRVVQSVRPSTTVRGVAPSVTVASVARGSARPKPPCYDELAGANAGALSSVVRFYRGRVRVSRRRDVGGVVAGVCCCRRPRCFRIIGDRAGALAVLRLALHKVNMATVSASDA